MPRSVAWRPLRRSWPRARRTAARTAGGGDEGQEEHERQQTQAEHERRELELLMKKQLDDAKAAAVTMASDYRAELRDAHSALERAQSERRCHTPPRS